MYIISLKIGDFFLRSHEYNRTAIISFMFQFAYSISSSITSETKNGICQSLQNNLIPLENC